jgi:hypothetical protein
MSRRMPKPGEHVKIEISEGDWILCKKRLTAGEQRRIFTRQMKTMVAGEKVELNPQQVGLSQMVEYLVDWSITDSDGKPVVIRDQSPAFVESALEMLDIESFNEILKAVQDHEAAMTVERELEKGRPFTESEQLVT